MNEFNITIFKDGMYFGVPGLEYIPRIGETVKHGTNTRKVKKVVYNCRKKYITIYI